MVVSGVLVVVVVVVSGVVLVLVLVEVVVDYGEVRENVSKYLRAKASYDQIVWLVKYLRKWFRVWYW